MTTDTRADYGALRQRIADLERDNRTLVGQVADLDIALADSIRLAGEWQRGFEGADRTIRQLTDCPESPLYGRTARAVMPDARIEPVPIDGHHTRLGDTSSGLSVRDARTVSRSGWLLMVLAVTAAVAVVTLRGPLGW